MTTLLQDRQAASVRVRAPKAGRKRLMDTLTKENFKALEGRRIAHVEIRAPDAVELAVPDSEGWRLVIRASSAGGDSAVLTARWEPGLRRPREYTLARRIVRYPLRLRRRVSAR